MYVVGYPKSGNSWICYLLSYCLNAEFDDFDNPGLYPKSKYISQFVKGGLKHRSYQKQLGKVLKTHKKYLTNSSSQKIVYIVRDGRDVMASYFHYEYGFKCSLPIYEPDLPLKSILHRIRWRLITKCYKPDFSTYLRKRLHEWVLHTKIYHELGFSALIKYEEVLASPEKALEKLFDQIGVHVEIPIIKEAVENFEFRKLAQRKQGVEDNQSFYRKGISGDWTNYFSEADLSYFYQTAGGVLDWMGYE